MPKAPEPSSTCQKTTKSLPRISPKSYCYNAVPNHFLAHFSTSRTNGPRLLSRAKAGTHSPSPTGSHTAGHTPKQGCFGRGWYHYPRTVSHVSETLRGRVSERRTLPLLGLGRGCSRKTQRACGTAMHSCASLFRRRRGPAGLRDLFRFCRNCGLYILRSGLSACARHGRYHYHRRALRAVETPDGLLSKRLTCRFLRSGEQRSLRSAYFLRIYRIFCRQFQLQTLLRYGTISSANWNLTFTHILFYFIRSQFSYFCMWIFFILSNIKHRCHLFAFLVFILFQE